MKLRDKEEVERELQEIRDWQTHQHHALNIKLYKRIVALAMMVIAAPVMSVGLTKASVAITKGLVFAAGFFVTLLIVLMVAVSVAIFHLLYD